MLPNTNSEPQSQSGQPDPSATVGDDSSQEVKITKAEWDNVQAALGRISGLQSERDLAKKVQTDFSQFREDVRPLLELAHSFGSQNKSLDEALSQIQTQQSEKDFRESMTTIAQALREGGTLPAGPGKTQGVDMTAVLAEYELDPRDTFVAAKLQGKTFANQAEAEAFAGKIFRDKAKAPNPNPAQDHTKPTTTAVTADEQEMEEVSAEYMELFKEPSKNRERMSQLEARMKELGG